MPGWGHLQRYCCSRCSILRNIIYLPYILFAALIIYGIAQKLRYGGLENQRFIEKWEQTREKGFWLYFIKMSAWTIFSIILIVISQQFLYYGNTPAEIVSALFAHNAPSLIILFVFLGFGCLVGAISWFEKENRYERM